MKIFRTQSIEAAIAESNKKTLKKTLGAFDLFMLGVGCTIGTGVFVLTGVAAAEHAGPAVSLSYLISGVICMLVALAYAELSATIPVSGGSYSYSYAALGEFAAWLVGSALVLEYMFGASTVAAGWSGYFVGILKSGGINIPETLTKIPHNGGIVNLPAMIISLIIGLFLIRGTKESIILNRVLVAIKLIVIFLFIYIAVPHIETQHWTTNFMPFGFEGVVAGAATIFFGYVGFDSVATASEESKNPSRDVPIGIISSLLFTIVVYVAVALSLTGIVSFSELNNAEPMAYALRQNGSNLGSAIIGTGTITGMLAVLLVLLYSKSRILFAMSRDGLIPAIFSKTHKKFGTPYISCIISTISVSLLAGFMPINTMGHITSFNTLLTFAIAALCVIVLRIRRPDIKRTFKCPAVFIIAPLAMVSCGYLMYSLLHSIALVFTVWFFLTLAIYVLYSYRHSLLNK